MATQVMSGRVFMNAIAPALGLSRWCQRVVIEVDLDSAVKIYVQQLLDTPTGNEIAKELSEAGEVEIIPVEFVHVDKDGTVLSISK